MTPYLLLEQTSIAATANPDRVARLASWLDALRTCAGETCRKAENTAPLRFRRAGE